ncbi:sulfur transferase domain-containing protein [Pseudoxanthomonas sp. Root630]|uniref:fused DSP-PTPase phosphatase/NAD kinase-like protein n=1 Tax=Pseudoxanthomonas sp. Root630 TaxID=1736574 RepID=UPI000702A8B2|nr:sulfur transferase domain-containing protein [Pseudoxanthomonas sp. Root630]KRA45305.1 hypothetical protein ASD72_08635 [Pseudoxanthomonas sp. Root630]
MKPLARVIALLALVLACFPLHAGDFTEPRPGLHTGGQPTLDELKRLKDEGVRTVIDLRGPQEVRGYDEAGEVEALGMTYIALPISGKEDISAANAQALHALLQGREGKVLLHCASGNRVGALLALGAAQLDGLSADEALALGRSAGLKSLEPVVVEQLATPAPAESK